MQERMLAQEKQREKQQGLGRSIISTQIGDNRVVAVGSEVLFGKWKTFHEFLFHYVMHAFGKDWWMSEASKEPANRHPLLNFYCEAAEQLKQAIKEPGIVVSIPTTGVIAAVIGLAYDLYLLSHNLGAQSALIARLKKPDQFFGAYYEASVAGILIRAGFDLEFQDESEVTTTHCEFMATWRETGRKFSVEAKRRAPEKTNFDVGNQLHSALKKRASDTRIVFIEVNVPQPVASSPEETLAKVLTGLTTREQKLTVDRQPAPPAYVILTNNPFFYHPDAQFQVWAAGEGFKIPDFKMNARFQNLREALVARDKHRELFAIMDSIRRHDKIPTTFDGEIPKLGTEENWPRLLVGDKIRITHDDGTGTVGTLQHACAVPERQAAFCFMLADGKNVLEEVPLTNAELAAYADHPDTFFGKYVPHAAAPLKDPLDMYDFFYKGHSGTSKERILDLLKDAEDIEQLKELPREDLLSIYCERLVYGVLTATDKTRAIGDGGEG
jgi:hypothetical protein